MTYTTLEFDVADGLATIVMVREDGGVNRLDADQIMEIADVAHRCAADSSIRAVLLTARGRGFSVGGDLKAFAAEEDRPLLMRRLTTHMHTAIGRFRRMDKPMVVAVTAAVGGGGMALAMVGDVVVAAESANFTMAYTAAGLNPDAGTTWLLPRLIGLRRAEELIYTNRRLSAQEAADWGLVTRCVPDETLQKEALRIARDLADGPTLAYAMAKRLMRSSFQASIDTQLEDEATAIATVMGSADADEGMMSFLEKRAPVFVGR